MIHRMDRPANIRANSISMAAVGIPVHSHQHTISIEWIVAAVIGLITVSR